MRGEKDTATTTFISTTPTTREYDEKKAMASLETPPSSLRKDLVIALAQLSNVAICNMLKKLREKLPKYSGFSAPNMIVAMIAYIDATCKSEPFTHPDSRKLSLARRQDVKMLANTRSINSLGIESEALSVHYLLKASSARAAHAAHVCSKGKPRRTINISTKEEETGRRQKTMACARRWSCSNLGSVVEEYGSG